MLHWSKRMRAELEKTSENKVACSNFVMSIGLEANGTYILAFFYIICTVCTCFLFYLKTNTCIVNLFVSPITGLPFIQILSESFNIFILKCSKIQMF